MAEIRNTKTFMRVVHRYLGYFLAGIMTVYAISGVLLIYRDADFLKTKKIIEKTIAPNLSQNELTKELKFKKLKIHNTKNGIIYFNKKGSYNLSTGEVTYHAKEYPYVLNKMTQLHKAKSGEALSPLNVFFGVALFFFSLSSFWMFNPKNKAFRRGIVLMIVGFVLTVLLLFI